MKIFVQAFVVAAMMLSVHSFAATPEAPPREPPYTDDNEFDSVLGEDPAATNQTIPVSPAPTQAQPSPESTLDDWSTSAAKPAQKKPEDKKVSYGRTPVYNEEVSKTPQKGVKLIHHPDAKKGLVRIEQDGTYVYKVTTTPKDKTGVVRFGFMDPPLIVSADGVTDYQTMYGSGPVPMIMFDYEWQPFSGFGKLGVQTGMGLAMSQGQGHFLKNGNEAQEKYTFITVPLNLGVIYRLEYFNRQWIAPYVSGGFSYIGVAEMRDDGKNTLSGTPAGYGAAGLMFSITALDKSVGFTLDNEYGVGNLWLVAEYRYIKAFSEDLDFNGGIMSVGISADF